MIVEPFRRLLLDVWREACRHIEIGQSAGAIAGMLSEHMPLRQLVVLRLDAEHSRVSLAAVAPALPSADWPSVQDLSERDLPKLKAWIRRGEPARIGRARRIPPALALLRWPDLPGDLLIAPLVATHAPIGLLVLVSHDGKQFLEKHEAMLASLQEPLAVALENDRRVHELAALREAAEADRRSLLTRLGRKELGDTIVGAAVGPAAGDAARAIDLPVGRAGADPRRDRHRQGADRPRHPQRQRPRTPARSSASTAAPFRRS